MSDLPNPQGLAQIPHRDGRTYIHERDGQRLNNQYDRIFSVMRDGEWRSLAAISALTGDPEASVGARLRDFRKKRFGGHTIENKCLGRGLWVYRLMGQLELL